MDCSSSDFWGNAGCNGGIEEYAYQYLMGAYSKLENENTYPYQASQNRCSAPHG